MILTWSEITGFTPAAKCKQDFRQEEMLQLLPKPDATRTKNQNNWQKNTSPVHKRRMLNTKSKINLATKKNKKEQTNHAINLPPLQRKKRNENVRLWIDPATTCGTRTIRSQVCTFKCRSRCKSSSLREGPRRWGFSPWSQGTPTGRLGLGLPLGNRGKYPAKQERRKIIDSKVPLQ